MKTLPWLVVVLSFFVAPIGSAQQAERVLVPIIYNGPGEHGSVWTTSMQVLNRMSQPYESPGVGFFTSAQCIIPEGCFWDALPSRAYGILAKEYNHVAAPSGMFLYVPSPEGRNLAFSLKIAATRDGRAFWTEVPLVSENEFRSDGVWLLSARVLPPSGITERLTLRVYDADGKGGRVRINAYPWHSVTDVPRATAELTLQPRTEAAPNGQPLYPGFAQVRVEEVFPAVQYGNGVWNLEIVPLPRDDGSQMRVWGFITMTDNQTNQVTVISPQ